jgi:hypothetical protein
MHAISVGKPKRNALEASHVRNVGTRTKYAYMEMGRETKNESKLLFCEHFSSNNKRNMQQLKRDWRTIRKKNQQLVTALRGVVQSAYLDPERSKQLENLLLVRSIQRQDKSGLTRD